jgi:indolepyruvate ferredoxin oxidoreductase alpha subunit
MCYKLGCPAIDWNDETGPIIDELQCVGCELCSMLCKPDALYMPENSYKKSLGKKS